jgi:hypothetical protein
MSVKVGGGIPVLAKAGGRPLSEPVRCSVGEEKRWVSAELCDHLFLHQMPQSVRVNQQATAHFGNGSSANAAWMSPRDELMRWRTLLRTVSLSSIRTVFQRKTKGRMVEGPSLPFGSQSKHFRPLLLRYFNHRGRVALYLCRNFLTRFQL